MGPAWSLPGRSTTTPHATRRGYTLRRQCHRLWLRSGCRRHESEPCMRQPPSEGRTTRPADAETDALHGAASGSVTGRDRPARRGGRPRTWAVRRPWIDVGSMEPPSAMCAEHRSRPPGAKLNGSRAQEMEWIRICSLPLLYGHRETPIPQAINLPSRSSNVACPTCCSSLPGCPSWQTSLRRCALAL